MEPKRQRNQASLFKRKSERVKKTIMMIRQVNAACLYKRRLTSVVVKVYQRENYHNYHDKFDEVPNL